MNGWVSSVAPIDCLFLTNVIELATFIKLFPGNSPRRCPSLRRFDIFKRKLFKQSGDEETGPVQTRKHIVILKFNLPKIVIKAVLCRFKQSILEKEIVV